MGAALSARRPWMGRRVVFGVTGGIAAYKSVQVARDLTRLGAVVDVVMTQAAQKFVAPLSFEAVTGRRVLTDLFSGEGAALHIRLGREADVPAARNRWLVPAAIAAVLVVGGGAAALLLRGGGSSGAGTRATGGAAPAGEVQLTVAVTAGGTVTSTPAGIECRPRYLAEIREWVGRHARVPRG